MKEWRPEELREQHGNKNLPVPAQVRHKKAMKASFAIKRGMNRARERVQEHNQAYVSRIRWEFANLVWGFGQVIRNMIFLSLILAGFLLLIASLWNNTWKKLFWLAYYPTKWFGSFLDLPIIQHPPAFLTSPPMIYLLYALAAVLGVVALVVFVALGTASVLLYVAPFVIIPAMIGYFLFPGENIQFVHFFPEYWIIRAAVGDAAEDLIRDRLERRKR